MFDMHNDLLTIAYTCYLNNDYRLLIDFYEIIKKNNIKGIVANLYFMSEKEMIEELGPNYYCKDISVVAMFVKAKEILNTYMPNINFKYSIEGCDYLNVKDLKILKDEGLTSLLLVWNNPNKYGSGIRSSLGLTDEGINFITEAMNLGIGIDLSHANEATFKDIINIIQKRKYPFVFASHSNIRNLFNHPRNLFIKQLEELKQVNGKLGLVAINYFCKDLDEYILHIKKAIEILGIDNVMVASDNMDFIGEQFKTITLIPYQKMNKILFERLNKFYSKEDVDKILFKNAIELFERNEEIK